MYKITNFIYQSKGSRNIYEKDMYNSMWKKKIWDKHSDYGPMEAKDVYISPFGSMSGVRNYVFQKLGYIIGETWIFKTK